MAQNQKEPFFYNNPCTGEIEYFDSAVTSKFHEDIKKKRVVGL